MCVVRCVHEYVRSEVCARIIIVIISYFCCAYLLRNLSSETQHNTIIKYNLIQERAKVIIRKRENGRFIVEVQFGINIF